MRRVRTLMIVLVLVALDLAGLIYGPPKICASASTVTVLMPFTVFFGFIARRIGINTLFR